MSKNDNSNPNEQAKKPVRSGFRLTRLAQKELKETLRDRRTIVTLVLMPLLVYPTLSLIFKTFLLSNASLFSTGELPEIRVVYSGNSSRDEADFVFAKIGQRIKFLNDKTADKQEALPRPDDENEGNGLPSMGSGLTGSGLEGEEADFPPWHLMRWQFIPLNASPSLADYVEAGEADLGIIFELNDPTRQKLGDFTIVSRQDAFSLAAAEHLAGELEKANLAEREFRLQMAGISIEPAVNVARKLIGEPVEQSSSSAFPLASLVPLILVLMTITGAVYPAIDLTAGERERGTLETLMAAPLPRVGILVAKFIAVLTVAIFTALLNLIGMFVTIWVFQLDQQFGGGIFDFRVMIQIFLLLILFGAFFSALLLAVTSFAKSFKEAQVYLIPIIILSLGPGLMAMAPGISLDGVNAVVPMVNILLLARDVINNEVILVPSFVAVVSTLVYTYLAICLAARIFGSDSILYSGEGSLAEMFQRPTRVNVVVPLAATLFCLVMLFPLNFLSIGFLGRLPAETTADLSFRYMMMGVFTCLAFLVLPALVAQHQNTCFAGGFGLNRPRAVFLLAAILLGISLWPLVMTMTEGWHAAYGGLFGSEKQEQWHAKLIETTSEQVARIRMVSPLVILFAFSVIPAVCEEWFFRGMLLRSLLKWNSVWKSILISALVFGSFHVLSTSVIALDRLLPSTLIGVMLGYLAFKSDSIWPGVILHSLNNGIVIFLAYYQPDLMNYSWFPGEDDPVPFVWALVGLIVATSGILLTRLARRSDLPGHSANATIEPGEVL